MRFADAVHLADEASDGEPRFERRSETAGSASAEELPRQIVLAVPPCSNFRATRVFDPIPIPGIASTGGSAHRKAL